MLFYNFMQNAFIAGTLIGIICGIVSFFIVLRKSSFIAHSLSHISLTGSSAALLIGVSQITGQLIANILAAIIIGILGEKIKKNDLVVGVVLTFFLGLGGYFISLYQMGYPGLIQSILFGNILTVSYNQIIMLFIMTFLIIFLFCIFSRTLFLSSIDPILAESKHISNKLFSILFLIILAITVTMACKIVGTLLLFSLLICPASSAIQWCDGIYKSISLSIIISLISIWGSLCLSFYFNLPSSFCVTTILFLIYIMSIIIKK